jgi:universal bacterial protein yeaZ
MKILGIESAALVASVAILDEDITIAEYTTNFKKTHSETLLPMLDEIIKMTGIDCSELSAIAVSGGPGSFTGLRIGAACAKGLGLALDLPLIHVPTLDAMALNIYSSDAIIVPIMDARRNQVYTGIYKNDCNLEIIKYSMAVAIDELFEILRDLDNKKEIKKIIFLGDGVPVFREYIDKNLEIAHDFAPANLNRQRASNIAMLGLKMFKEGKSLLSDDMRPEYLRKSQAERERNVDKTDAGL